MDDLPRVIELKDFVDARGPELAALLQDVRTREGEKFGRRLLRRRATAHKRYTSSKKRPNLKLARNQDGSRPTNRAMRRRLNQLPSLHHPPFSAPLVEGKEQVSLITRRLETHVWHARRMMMGSRFGFTLPLQSFGRGHGSRALMKRTLIMHDASYLSCFVIKGGKPRWALSALRECCLESSLGEISDQRPRVMMGEIEVDILLASELDLICPARAMVVRGDVWIWVHPLAASEAGKALSNACKRHGCLLTLAPLKRIEVRGSASESALLSILSVNSRSPQPPSTSLWLTLQQERRAGGIKPWFWPPNSMLGLGSTIDPRLAEMDVGGLTFHGATTLGHHSAERSSAGDKPPASDVSIWTRDAIDQIKLEIDHNASTSDQVSILPLAHPLPMSSDQVASIRRQWRKNLLSPKPQNNDVSSITRDSFPLLIVRRALSQGQGGRFDGFSIIVPMGWVTPVWHSLALKGARAAGLQEWRWIASGGSTSPVPSFPYDFPNTASGLSWRSDERQRHELEARRRPMGKARRVKDAASYIPWSTGIGKKIECLHEADGKMVVSGKETRVDQLVLMSRPKGGLNSLKGSQGSPMDHLMDERWTGLLNLRPNLRQSWSDLCTTSENKSNISLLSSRVETRVERKMRRALEQHLYKLEGVKEGHSHPSPTPSPQMMELSQIHGDLSFAFVSVRMAGRGQCEAGAAIVIPTTRESSTSDNLPKVVTMAVVGYVTSSSPRGSHSPGSRPTGLAICHLPSLLQHLDLKSSHADYAPAVKVWMKNPDSQSLRKATIKPIASQNCPLVIM